VFFRIPPRAPRQFAGVEVSPRVEARLGAIAFCYGSLIIVFSV